jgi:hypothetical protein
MKRIKNFNSFIIDEGLGFIIGKHDVSYVVDCILDLYNLYENRWEIKITVDNKKITISPDMFGWLKNNGVGGYYPSTQTILLNTTIKWDKNNLTQMIVHELTHALDPWITSNRNGKGNPELYKLRKIWDDEPSIEGKKKAYEKYQKKYLSDTEEIEAYTTQYCYIFNDLLCLYPEKLERAKQEISKGNLDLPDIFEYERSTSIPKSDVLTLSKKIRDKVLRRAAMICLNQEKGNQIKDVEAEPFTESESDILKFLCNDIEISKPDLPIVPFGPKQKNSRDLIKIGFLETNSDEKDSLRSYCKALISNAIYYSVFMGRNPKNNINIDSYTVKDVIENYIPTEGLEEDFYIKMWNEMNRDKMIKISGLSDSDLNTKIWDLAKPDYKETINSFKILNRIKNGE